MRNILIIYEFDEDYIIRCLSFFKIFSIKEKFPLNFYAKKWLKNKLSEDTIFVDDNFNITNIKINKLEFFSSSIIISLNPELENENHRLISIYLKKFKIDQMNPFSPSFFAVNKYKTIKKLKNLGIETPETVLIEFRDRKNLKNKIGKFIDLKEDVYVQPLSETEGRQTYFFTKMEIKEDFNFFEKTILNILAEQSAILKEKRGNICYFKEEEKRKGFRGVVFRFFIFKWRKKIVPHWCFVEICPEEKTPISSPLKGGTILNFEEIKDNLYYKKNGDFERFILTERHKLKIISEVEKIFKLFNKGMKEELKIGGMDILIETDGKSIKPVFLELNPRPSGLDKLSHF